MNLRRAFAVVPLAAATFAIPLHARELPDFEEVVAELCATGLPTSSGSTAALLRHLDFSESETLALREAQLDLLSSQPPGRVDVTDPVALEVRIHQFESVFDALAARLDAPSLALLKEHLRPSQGAHEDPRLGPRSRAAYADFDRYWSTR